MESIITLIWILSAFVYAGKKGKDYFETDKGLAVLGVVVLNFVGFPVMVLLREFEVIE